MDRQEALKQAIEMYFDGLYHGDVDAFRTVFHPQAQLYCGTEGTMLNLNVGQYLDIVANRPSPENKGDLRQDEIVSISIGTPTTAHVRVRCVYLPKRFVDDLTFVFMDERWRIVSKVWHFET